MLDDASGTRILPDDQLIDVAETRAIMGGISTSAAYDDPGLMALKIKIGDGTGRQCRVRFIRREILNLRAQRVTRSEANAAGIRAQVEKRLALRRKKRRMRAAASP
jgi:hypothetical protein